MRSSWLDFRSPNYLLIWITNPLVVNGSEIEPGILAWWAETLPRSHRVLKYYVVALCFKGAQSVVTLSSSVPDVERFGIPVEPLTVATSPKVVIRAMMHPESGLDIRDRIWLKITLPNAFIGESASPLAPSLSISPYPF